MASATPAFFHDLGKAARDIFERGYDYPKVKLSLKTKTDSNVKFETSGSHDLDKGRTSGSIKTKLEFPDYGVTFEEVWHTTSELEAELKYEPKGVENLELVLKSCFLPSSGHKSALVKAAFRREYLAMDGRVDLDIAGPSFKGSSVLMYNGYYAGYQVGYNTSNAKVTANNIAAGYTCKEFTVHCSLADVADCQSSVHHKLSDRTEVGINTTYNLQTSNVSLGMAGKYTMDDGAVMRAKVNNQGQIGCGYSHLLRTGVKLSLSGLIEGRNINAGGHKLGVSLEFES